MKTDIFWYNDVRVLFNPKQVYEIIPFQQYSIERKLNALVRLSALVFTLLALVLKNVNILLLFFVSLLVTYVIYLHHNTSETFTENTTPVTIVQPTPNNPFMNITPDDYINRPNRDIPADLLEDINLQKDIEFSFEDNLYIDANDVFGRNNSQRQFYTTPVTTIPNKQKDLGNWLYKTPPTCKEGSGNQCLINLPKQGVNIKT